MTDIVNNQYIEQMLNVTENNDGLWNRCGRQKDKNTVRDFQKGGWTIWSKGKIFEGAVNRVLVWTE